MKWRIWAFIFRMVLYLFSLPLLLIWHLIRGIRGLRSLHHAQITSIQCSNCNYHISLVGIWKCACGYTYRGHVMRCCPQCSRTANLVRCLRCQVTYKLA